MSVRHDLEFVKGDSIEFKIKFDGGISNIHDIKFAVKANYKATEKSIDVRYSYPTSDGEITLEGNNLYNCLVYATTTAASSLIPSTYVYEIKVTTQYYDDQYNIVTRVYTPVYGQFKLLPNVTLG